ncbi:MAG: SdpI family protein [Caldilineaceae bacterium]
MTTQTTFNFKKLWIWSAVIIAIMVAISAWAWTQVPAGAQVPIHWNAAGQPDNYGNKFVGIFLMPMVAVSVVLLFSLIRFIDPLRANIVRSGPAFRATLLGTLFFMLALHVATMLYVAGYPFNIGYIAAPAVGLMFIVMGNYLGKIRRNYMFGVRTPWTLASELSWNKTHRFAGKLFVLTGLLIVLITLLESGVGLLCHDWRDRRYIGADHGLFLLGLEK